MKKICIANQKGGVGKSTTAICMSAILSQKKKKVLCIDTDPQCNTSSFYGAVMKEMPTLADIIYGEMDATECIQHTKIGDIIPSDTELKDAETRVPVDEARFLHLKRACSNLKGYDYVIIDTPPNIGIILKNVLAYVDEVIIPIQESGWAITGLMDFYSAIELSRGTVNPGLKISGLLTVMAKTKTTKSQRINDIADDLSKKIETTPFKTKIRESVRCTEALTEYHVPLHEYAPKCTTQKDYEEFVKEFLKREKESLK